MRRKIYINKSVKRANENLHYYTEKMQGLVRVYNQMNLERKQIMTDSLNKLVLFETSMEMTLKYDTKMFVKLIEEIILPEMEDKEAPKTESEVDKSKGDETTQNDSKISATSSENILSEEYNDYLARFDQFGEYKFDEIPEESSSTPVIHDPIKSKYEEDIFSLVQSIINEEERKGPISQIEMDNFILIMEEKLGRSVLLDYLNTFGTKDIKLANKAAFDELSDIIVACFDRVLRHNDRENGLKLVETCDKFYYLHSSNGEVKETMRIYLTRSIENLGPVKDTEFWEKMIFESIRRELKNDFFEYDFEADTENAYREIVFYRLSNFLSTMLSFGISKDKTKTLIIKF